MPNKTFNADKNSSLFTVQLIVRRRKYLRDNYTGIIILRVSKVVILTLTI
jgi:hypothetical protein